MLRNFYAIIAPHMPGRRIVIEKLKPPNVGSLLRQKTLLNLRRGLQVAQLQVQLAKFHRSRRLGAGADQDVQVFLPELLALVQGVNLDNPPGPFRPD